MIEINLNTARYKLTVTGHATPEESAEYKEICAAASAIAQSLAYSVTKYHEGESPLKSFEYRPDPGDLMIRAWPEEWAELAIGRRFRIYGEGMELLARSHPQSVTMIWDGERILPETERSKT